MSTAVVFDNIGHEHPAPRVVNYQLRGPVTLVSLATAINTTPDQITVVGVSIVTSHVSNQILTQTFLKLSIAAN